MIKFVEFLLLASIAVCYSVVGAKSPSNHLRLDQELDPALAERIAEEFAANPEATVDREKRLVLLKKIGLKAGLIDLIFGKIDSFIDSKTHFINELDKQNIYKNQKYFGISPPQPKSHYYYNHNNDLVGTLLEAKKNFISSAVSSLISKKLSHLSGSFGFDSLSGGSHGGHGGGGASVSVGSGLGGGASVGVGSGLGGGASVGVGSGLGSGASVSVGSGLGGGASVGVGSGLGGGASVGVGSGLGSGASVSVGSGLGATFGAGASLPGVGSASAGTSVTLPSFDVGASAGVPQAVYGYF